MGCLIKMIQKMFTCGTRSSQAGRVPFLTLWMASSKGGCSGLAAQGRLGNEGILRDLVHNLGGGAGPCLGAWAGIDPQPWVGVQGAPQENPFAAFSSKLVSNKFHVVAQCGHSVPKVSQNAARWLLNGAHMFPN